MKYDPEVFEQAANKIREGHPNSPYTCDAIHMRGTDYTQITPEKSLWKEMHWESHTHLWFGQESHENQLFRETFLREAAIALRNYYEENE